MTLPPLSLYVHLPWCERKCPYCDFNSHERDDLPEEAYVAALLLDLESDLPLLQQRPIESIFIGGGTPSLFSIQSIQMLLQGIADSAPLAEDAEITLEANPSSAEAEKFAGFHAAGINRISLGIQSFDDASLAALGRVHNAAQAESAIQAVQAAGFDNFNLDLMHGLPGQTDRAAEHDLATAIDCEPTHLSWYQLTIEPNTVFYKQPPDIPLEAELADIQATGEALLARAGYSQYEVSAYARDGRRSRHNLNYWTFGDYLGVGAGAHGKISYADGTVMRYAKRRQPDEYLSAQSGQTVERRRLTVEDIRGEFAMNALRLREGFSLALFRERTGQDQSAIDAVVDDLCTRDLLRRDGDIIRTTATGFRYLDSVVAEFFQTA